MTSRNFYAARRQNLVTNAEFDSSLFLNRSLKLSRADLAIPEAVHEQVRAVFEPHELNDLVWVVATINARNRVNIRLRTVPGDYQAPRMAHAT